jgi:hypothetical protein
MLFADRNLQAQIPVAKTPEGGRIRGRVASNS